MHQPSRGVVAPRLPVGRGSQAVATTRIIRTSTCPSTRALRQREMVVVQKALSNYEAFYELPRGSATVDQVQKSAAGISGWSKAVLAPASKANETTTSASGATSSGSASASRCQLAKEADEEASRCKAARIVNADIGERQFEHCAASMSLATLDEANPIHVLVNSMGGETVEVQARSGELVAHLRRRIAKALDKPLTQLVLARDTTLLHGMQLVGEVVEGPADEVVDDARTGAVDDPKRVELSAFVSEEGGPVEEMMDFDDPQQLAEYAPDLYTGLKRQEAKATICPDYMSRQAVITPRMRAILVDWLVEVHMKYRLRPATLFLAVNVLDRYLQTVNIEKKRLQLAGVASLMIASKFEDVHPPELKDFVYICDRAYTANDVLGMEATILCALGFNLCLPTAGHFLSLYQQANRCDENHGFVVQYLVELTLGEIGTFGELPSKVVAAATLLSNQLLLREVYWPDGIASYTGFSAEMLEDLVSKMRQFLSSAATAGLQAVIRKFRTSRFGSVASTLS